MLLVRFRHSHCCVSIVYAALELLLALGAIWVWDLWYKPPCLTNISSRCFAPLLAKMSTFNIYEWTASSSLHMTPELEQWTWLLCRVSVAQTNTLSLQGLTQLIGTKLLISRFQEIFACQSQFPRGKCPFCPSLRTPMCLVLVLPNLKLHQEKNFFFDEKGKEVFISKNFWNKFLSGICYMLGLPNGPSRKSANCYSGVGGGGAGDAKAPPKVFICQKFGQNLWKSG